MGQDCILRLHPKSQDSMSDGTEILIGATEKGEKNH